MKEITIHRLEKKFGDVHALKAADLKIPAGSFTTLLGPSGCGKTTLLRLIAGLETPDAGEILIDDEFIFQAAKELATLFIAVTLAWFFKISPSGRI